MSSPTKRKLAVVPSSRPEDQARVPLDAAIKAAAKAKERLAAHGAAIRRADQQVTASERKLEELQAALAAAKSGYAGELARSVAAGAAVIPGTPKALRDAETALADAASTLDAVRIAAIRLKADLRGVEIDLHLAELDVMAALDAALAPSIEKLVALAEHGRVVMYQCAAILGELRSGAGRDPYFRWAESEWREQSDANKRRGELRALAEKIDALALRIHNKDKDTGIAEAVAAWRGAVARLRAEPTSAELPPLPGT
jgi:hypothetical protein